MKLKSILSIPIIGFFPFYFTYIHNSIYIGFQVGIIIAIGSFLNYLKRNYHNNKESNKAEIIRLCTYHAIGSLFGILLGIHYNSMKENIISILGL